MGEGGFFGCRKLSPVRFGLGVGVNQLLFQLGSFLPFFGVKEGTLFHLTATTRIAL